MWGGDQSLLSAKLGAWEEDVNRGVKAYSTGQLKIFKFILESM